MPIRRSADTTPDLFSAPPSAKAPDPKGASQGKAHTNDPELQTRHILPKDLDGSLRRLDDGEIAALLSSVTKEAERRGRLPKRQSVTGAKLQARRPAVEEFAGA